jgi:hypothetical protein
MDDSDLMVDGNALGGVLSELFVHEMTSAPVACGGCGKVEPLGAEHAFTQAPGIVLRCRHCQGVLLVITKRGSEYLLALQGSMWIQITPDPRGI